MGHLILLQEKLGNTNPCITHQQPLPGSEQPKAIKHTASLAKPVYQFMLIIDIGERAQQFLTDSKKPSDYL